MTISQCQSTEMSIDYNLNTQYCDQNKSVILTKPKPVSGGNRVCRIQRRMIGPIQPKSESKLIRFFQNISHWRLHSPHIGYYSPRMNHSIDTINLRLNPSVVVTNKDAPQIFERNFIHFDNANNKNHNDYDNDSMSNSLREDNEMVIKDELATYMEELRLREIR